MNNRLAKRIFFLFITSVLLGALLVPVVFAQEASSEGLVTCGGPGQAPCNYNDLVDLVGRVVNFMLIYIAIPVGVAFLIYGGVLVMISAGNESKVKQAKELVRSVVVGLLIAFGAWAIINTLLTFLFP